MSTDVFHEGERRVQQKTGQTEEANRNAPMIDDRIPSGAIPFLRQQSLLVFALLDQQAVWCLPAVGQPGWIAADRNAIHLDLAQTLCKIDQRLMDAATHGHRVGCIALDFATRRRLRINGTLQQDAENTLSLTVAEAFPNCPKYITSRTLNWSGESSPHPLHSGRGLTGTQRQTLQRADVFFIASQHPTRGLDASHRGGNPGFVESPNPHTLRFLDYPGNGMFNTLGNLELDTRLGILIPDFQASRALALTGTAAVAYEQAGATRWITITIEKWTEVELPLTDAARQLSPYNP